MISLRVTENPMRNIYTKRSCRAGEAWRGKKAFTLLELLVVMGLMMLIMGIAVANWFSLRRGAEMRRSISTVQTTMMLARQSAVTKRKTVTVQFGQTVTAGMTYHTMSVKVGANSIHTPMYLSPGVTFVGTPADIQFTPNGRTTGVGLVTISLVETVAQGGTPRTAAIDVWMLTGTTRVR